MKMLMMAVVAVQSFALLAGGDYYWSGGGKSGDWNDATNWGGAGVPSAGDTATFDSSVTITTDFSVGSGSALVISAGSGATVEFTGAISGSAPITLEGAGAIGFGGENTFTGALTVQVTTFRARSDGAFGTTDGATTFIATSSSSKWYFHGITTAEAITVNNSPGPTSLQFPAGSTNVFNGVWSRVIGEQYRASVGQNAYVRFNADFAGDIQHMTVSLAAGSILDFNAALRSGSPGEGGAPRLTGTGTVIYRKPLTLPTCSTYGFFYQHNGIQKLMAANLLGEGASATALTTHIANGYTATLDLQGNDQDCAALFGNTTNLTTPEDCPATLHVYNSASASNKYANDGKFVGKVTGPVSIAVEGNSALDALTLCSVSESKGTLIARNGGKAVFSGVGVWGTGGATIGAGSSIVIVNANTFGNESALTVEAGGAIDIADGVVQTVKTLQLGDVKGVNGKKYGSLDTTASVDVKSACITGNGIVKVVNGKSLVWKGSSGGLWSLASNWEPSGVPGSGDSLTFDSTAGAIFSVNDISGLTLAKISLAGANAISLSGAKVVLLNEGGLSDAGEVSAAGCTGGITFALPLEAVGTSGIVIRATAASSCEFTGAWSGSADIRFDGDHTGVYAFKQNSPNFTGNLYLSNAGAYHLWNAGALGTTDGYTRYEVRQGNYDDNGGKLLEPFYFHDIDTSENFLLAGYSTVSLVFPEGTTNCLRGAIDTPSDRYDTKKPDVERFSIGANAKLTVSGDVAKKFTSGCDVFEIVLFNGAVGSTVILDSEWGGGRIRACPVAGAEFVQNTPQTHVGYVGLYTAGTYRFGCDDALGETGATTFTCGYNNNTPRADIDLAGHRLVLKNFTYSYSSQQHGYVQFVDSVSGGTLVCDVANFISPLASAIQVKVQTAGTHAFNPSSCASGVALSVSNGAHVTTSSDIPIQAVAVDATSSLSLAAGAALSTQTAVAIATGGTIDLADVLNMPVGSITLGGVAQPVGFSYGSAQSSADSPSAYFTGKGLLRLAGVIDPTVRTWKGPSGGKWSASDNWDPAGTIGYGNILVFDSTASALTSDNDIDLVRISEILVKGDNPIALTGKNCGILSGGGISGDVDALAEVTLALPLTLVPDSSEAVALNAASGQVIRVTGAIAGSADCVIGGAGAVELRADNTFTGLLTYTNGILDVYTDGAFGTTDGKTVVRVPDAVPAGCRAPRVTFHGITTSEAIEWYQTYGATAGYFAEATTNTFNGAFRGIGGQPRWRLEEDAKLVVNGTMTDFKIFTVDSADGAVYEQRGTYDGQTIRMEGNAEYRLYNTCTFSIFEYAQLFRYRETDRPLMTFWTNDVLVAKDNKIVYSPLSVGAGTADLNGYSQKVLVLNGAPGVTVTNSGAKVELRAMMVTDLPQTVDGGSGIKFTPSRYDGSIAGPIDFTVDGSGMPTQFLGGVSAPLGKLTVKNGATVCLDGAARWGGAVDVCEASTLVFRDRANFGRGTTLNLAAGARIHLETDIRCHQLCVGGVVQPTGTYGAATDPTRFSGPGTLSVVGGTLFLVR